MDFGFCVGEWGRMGMLCVCPGTNHPRILRDVLIFLAASVTSRLSLNMIIPKTGLWQLLLISSWSHCTLYCIDLM